MAIRIVLADDHHLFRELLGERLQTMDGFEVVGGAGNGLVAVGLCGQLLPDVAILDLTMPGMDGLTAIPLIREVAPDTRCLVLTGQRGPDKLREVLQAGGVGYLVKNTSLEILSLAIRRVAAGHSFIDLPGDAFEDLSEVVSDPPPPPGESLSSHERELLRLLGLGHTNKEISAELHLAVKTIEAHRAKLMTKLGIQKRSELVSCAIRLGVLRDL